MNPLVKRGRLPADPGAAPPGDAPSQVIQPTEDAPSTLGAEDATQRFSGELFLPGWLPIELDSTAEQGPGG